MEQKNTFLKVMSILCIIGGIIGLIVAISALAVGAGGAVILANAGAGAGLVANAGILMIAGIIALIAAIFELIAGKAGFNALKDPSKANVCVILGIIMIVLSLVSTIMTAVSYGTFGGSNVSSVFLGIIFPVLYILAAKKGWTNA